MRLVIAFIALTLTLVQLLDSRMVYAAGGDDSGKNSITIRIGTQPGVNAISVVKHYGWLEKQGYKVKYISFTQAGPELRALAAGSLDMMAAGAAPEMILSTRYKNSWLVATPVLIGNQLIVPAKSNIKSVQDLRGKRIAYPGPASQQFAMLATALQGTGVKPSDINLYKSSPADMLSLMKRGQIDGFIAWPTFTSEAVRTGAGRTLLNAQDVFEKAGGKGKWIEYGFLVYSKFAQEHPKALIAVLKAQARAIRHQRQAVRALSAETGLSKEAISYSIDKKFNVFADTIVPNRGTVSDMMKIFVNAGLVKGINITEFVDEYVHPEFAEKAEAELKKEASK